MTSRYQSLTKNTPTIFGNVLHTDPNLLTNLEKQLVALKIPIKKLNIKLREYQKYRRLTKSLYQRYFDEILKKNITTLSEKSLEHWLSFVFLDPKPGEVFIDVASASSPVPKIVNSLFACTVYAQDLRYENGIHEGKIGGDASAIPLPNGSVDKMSLHCSFEHFEQNSDIDFLKECSRLLKPKGKVCILPLYLFSIYAFETDPEVVKKERVLFETDSTIFLVPKFGCRHSRFYDIRHFKERILDNLTGLKPTIYLVSGQKTIDLRCWLNWVLVLEKT